LPEKNETLHNHDYSKIIPVREPLKILVYGINYYPELTGTGKYTAEMCEWLARRGHRIDVITSFPFYPQWKIYEPYRNKRWHRDTVNGVTIHRVPLYVPEKVTGKTRILHELSFGLNSLYYWIPKLFRRYDAAIGVCPPMQMGLLPCIYKFLHRSPFVFQVQDLQVDAARSLGLIKNEKLLYLLDKVERFLLRQSTVVSTISDGMKRKIVSKGVKEDNIFLLPNWADTDFIKPMAKGESLKKDLGFEEEDRIVLYSGNIGEKQGLEMVINVAGKLRSEKDLHFVFVGEGAARERLQNMVREKNLPNVSFHPLQPYEKLPQLLAMADLHLVIQKTAASDLVMPSKLASILASGGLSITTAERGSSLYNMIEENNVGLLIEPEDNEALYNVIKNNLDSDLSTLRNAARKFAEDYLDKEKILSSFEKLLHSLSD
jgi:colanic acid biosynthesis glycosyl transferase WcaI